MARDIYLDDSWNTEQASTGDIQTVTGDPQRGQQVASIVWNVVEPHLGSAMDDGTIVGIQGQIRTELLRADAVDSVSTVDITERTHETIELLVSTNVVDVTVPIDLNRP